MRNRTRAFTLVELLVVIAIISILAAMLFPVFSSARAAARRTVCISNLRQIGMALSMYREDWGALPQHLSDADGAYVKEPRVFVCPNDPNGGQYAGTLRLEGNLYLPSGVSYDYVPQWAVAQELGWWYPAPEFGGGKWEDMTPVADCQWHWARTFNATWNRDSLSKRGWQLILMMSGSVRKIRVEEPIEEFTPDKYR